MAPSEAQKRASNKYNLENMTVLGCKVKKAEAAAFKDYCALQGKTSNTVLKEFVMERIGGGCGPDGLPDTVRGLCRAYYQRLQALVQGAGPLDAEAKGELLHILAEEERAGADAISGAMGAPKL